MRFDRIALHSAVIAGAMLAATAARADNSPLGLWIDHTGRGGVEITDCNGKLCGHVAWLKDNENADQCGKQIIGNVKPVGKNKWDNGWIFDPDRGSKYDVELTAVSADKLKVMGYAGTKWLSETYTWKRAAADLQKCNATGDSAAKTTPAPAAAKPATTATSETPKPAPVAKSDAVQLDATKSDGDSTDSAKPATAKAEASKPAVTETAKPTTEAAKPAETEATEPSDTTTADAEDDAGDEPQGEKPGKVLARIMDELASGDGPVKIKRTGKNCKVTAPFVGVVTFPCDGEDD